MERREEGEKISDTFDRMLPGGGEKVKVQKSLDGGTLVREGRREAAKGSFSVCVEKRGGWVAGRQEH